MVITQRYPFFFGKLLLNQHILLITTYLAKMSLVYSNGATQTVVKRKLLMIAASWNVFGSFKEGRLALEDITEEEWKDM